MFTVCFVFGFTCWRFLLMSLLKNFKRLLNWHIYRHSISRSHFQILRIALHQSLHLYTWKILLIQVNYTLLCIYLLWLTKQNDVLWCVSNFWHIGRIKFLKWFSVIWRQSLIALLFIFICIKCIILDYTKIFFYFNMKLKEGFLVAFPLHRKV